uniref:Variant surface glycoprotein n=1 Tax=Trypanosoma brucei TaxID=5691 RepID=A0A1V0FY93_9TRYP|nr:variant surface glycoprotein [Trypanosoma brucei]
MFCALLPRISRAAAPADGVNSKLFDLLCEAMTMTAPKAQGPNTKLQTNAKHTALLVSLISTDKNALLMLKQSPAGESAPTNLKGKIKEICDGKKLQDCKDAIEWAESDENKELLKLLTAASQNWPLPPHLNDTATALSTACEDPQLQAQELAQQKLQREITAAQLGGRQPGAEFKIEGASSGRAATCGTTGEDPKAGVQKALAAVLICVCGSDSSNDNNKGCAATQTAQVTYSAEHSSHGAALTTLVAQCGKRSNSNKETTEGRLAALTANLARELETPHGSDHKRGYIGWTEAGNAAGNCDGTAETGKGACVYYNLNNDQVKKPTWLAELEKATVTAKELASTAAAAKAQEQHIKQLNHSLVELLRQSILNNRGHATRAAQTVAQPNKLTEADCANHQTNTTCVSPCTWHEKESDPNKKCSLDPAKGAEQQATQTSTAGAGKQAGEAAATGCAKHGTKNYCEEEKTGDKQICAFRKGKDNEPEKDKEMCRNGSFLGNKKFALGVAALVGFVEF